MIRVCTLMLSVALCCLAQPREAGGFIESREAIRLFEGSVVSNIDPRRLTVELEEVGGVGTQRSLLDSAGEFRFRLARSGNYCLTVFGPAREVLWSEVTQISSHPLRLEIRLQLPMQPRPASGTVSIARLSHRVPRGAVQAFQKAAKAQKKGDTAHAIALLEGAVKTDSQFFEAQNNLGALLLAQGDYERSRQSFERAVALDPSSALAQCNLGMALLALNQADSAEQAARSALRIDPTLKAARFLLGKSLTQQRKAPAEALSNLRDAQDAYPDARIVVASLLVSQGRIVEARDEMRDYLRSGATRFRRTAELFLTQATYPAQ